MVEGNTEKLLYLKEGETKEIIWKIKAPEKEIKKGHYEYEVLLMLPDGNLSDRIKVVRGTGETEQGIEITDVSPFINDGKMRINIGLKNMGNADENVQITVTINNETKTETTIVEALGGKTYSIEFDTNEAEKAALEIETNYELKQYEITIPNKIEPEMIVVNKQDTGELWPNEKNTENPVSAEILIIAVAVIALTGATVQEVMKRNKV